MTDESGNVVRFRPGARPSARLKPLHRDDKRWHCRHAAVWVSPTEPILECRDCDAVVDPYQWIRARCRDWEQVIEEVERRRQEAQRELATIQAALRKLRGEYRDEQERREAERAIAMLPPPRRTRP